MLVLTGNIKKSLKVVKTYHATALLLMPASRKSMKNADNSTDFYKAVQFLDLLIGNSDGIPVSVVVEISLRLVLRFIG